MNDSGIKHIGFILDGNRRWAKEHERPKYEGHKAGYDRLKEVAQHAILDLKIPFVSAYIFSTENWNRAKDEVDYLMGLATRMATKDLQELHEKNIRVIWLGSKKGVPDKVRNSIEDAVVKTKENTAGTLALCFNYGGRNEIIDAIKKLGDKASQITEEVFSKYLYGSDIPDIDLMIRTSGEQRISNFMLWRMAYAELYFTDKHWPDFDNTELDKAVEEYKNRGRRFGK